MSKNTRRPFIIMYITLFYTSLPPSGAPILDSVDHHQPDHQLENSMNTLLPFVSVIGLRKTWMSTVQQCCSGRRRGKLPKFPPVASASIIKTLSSLLSSPLIVSLLLLLSVQHDNQCSQY